MFYDKGLANGTRKELLDYVWNYQISLQLGYSFSEIHTTGYALIALQEMNLAYKYPIIYWNCACLSVDSSAINSADFYNLVDDDIIDTSEVDGKKAQNKMDYAKLASALDNFRKICDIKTPDINKSRLSFTPLVKENAILYGLKGISRVTEPVIQEIMLNRPFSSLQDFLNKVTKKIVTKDKVINLIKCGAFNEIEKKSTKEILKDFIWTTCEPKKRITLQNANMLIDLNLLPEKYEYVSDVYKITKELRKHRDSAKLWYIGDNLDVPYDKVESWRNIIKDAKIEGKDIIVDGEPHRVMESAAWDRFYENQMDFLRTYITTHQAELLKSLNDTLFENEFNKYCSGDKDKWELDSLNFYFNNHPLTKVIPQISNIDIDSIEDVVEGAQDGMFYIKGKEIPKMKLYTIVGTVIDKDKVKGMVTIQTPTGVVNLKIYKDLFATFVNVIGTIDEQTGEKDIEQDSFFEKGTHLLVTGILRGITFVPKVYKNTGHKAIMKINLDKDGNFINLEEKKNG